jgi:hypothetical protein
MTKELTNEYIALLANDLPEKASPVQIAKLIAVTMSVYGIEEVDEMLNVFAISHMILDSDENYGFTVSIDKTALH